MPAAETRRSGASRPESDSRSAEPARRGCGRSPTTAPAREVTTAGNGRVSAATRADYAEAAAAVLTEDGHAGATYELSGPAFTMPKLAEVVSQNTGQTVSYTDLPVDQYTHVLVGAGLPEPVAAVFADGDRGVADGELHVDPADLEKLLGRPATPLAGAVAQAAAALRERNPLPPPVLPEPACRDAGHPVFKEEVQVHSRESSSAPRGK